MKTDHHLPRGARLVVRARPAGEFVLHRVHQGGEIAPPPGDDAGRDLLT